MKFPVDQRGWKCRSCDDEIYSNSRHDFVSCLCGATSVDGGFDYFRALWSERVGPGIPVSRTLTEYPPYYFREDKE